MYKFRKFLRKNWTYEEIKLLTKFQKLFKGFLFKIHKKCPGECFEPGGYELSCRGENASSYLARGYECRLAVSNACLLCKRVTLRWLSMQPELTKSEENVHTELKVFLL